MIMVQNIISVFDRDNGLCSVVFPAHSLPLFDHLILSWGSVTVFPPKVTQATARPGL